ncbi:MAG: hypothetical protein ACP5K0_07560, partial [Thermosulfidibacteraceae bacterium]
NSIYWKIQCENRKKGYKNQGGTIDKFREVREKPFHNPSVLFEILHNRFFAQMRDMSQIFSP